MVKIASFFNENIAKTDLIKKTEVTANRETNNGSTR